jgi:hypothetical protein
LNIYIRNAYRGNEPSLYCLKALSSDIPHIYEISKEKVQLCRPHQQ